MPTGVYEHQSADPMDRFWPKVVVLDLDECWNWTAATDGKGYGLFRPPRGFSGRAHRFLYEWIVDTVPEGYVLDHRCLNKRCVNLTHLRLATHKQNGEHRGGANRNNQSSGIRGVTWEPRLHKWRAQVSSDWKAYYLGLFLTIEEAEAAVVAKRLELFTFNDVDQDYLPRE